MNDNDLERNLTPLNENGEIDFKALIEMEDRKSSRRHDTKEVYDKKELDRYREEYNFFNPDYDLYNDDYTSNRKERNTHRLSDDISPNVKKFFSGLLKFTAGFTLASFLILYVLPGMSIFKKTPLYRILEKNAVETAYEVSLSAGKAVVNESNTPMQSKDKLLTVPDIVEQYNSAVVTVVTKIKDSKENKTFKNYIGTGFILDSKGNIATNYHVVDGADEITVIFYDGTEHDAIVVNSDELSDLSILNIIENVEMPGVVTIGDSNDIQVGEGVVAIGNPLNRTFAGTVTSGIISAKEREVEIAGTKIKYIQTDTAINEGNSGGPLFNMNGEVIGLNTAKLKRSDIEGIGFAIPINILKDKMAYLSTPPVYAGFTAKDLTEDELRRLNIGNGVILIEVKNNTPADRKGLRIGDVITKIDGIPVKTTAQLNEIKSKKKAGEIIKLTIFRSNRTFEVDVPMVQNN